MLYSKRAEAFLPDYWPTYFTKTKGCYVWSKDGNKYTDMIFAVGTNVLGYNNPILEKDIINSVKKGNMSTLNCYEEIQLTEELLKIDKWAGMVKYARTGAEANLLQLELQSLSKKNLMLQLVDIMDGMIGICLQIYLTEIILIII